LIAILTAVIGLVGVVLAPILSDWIRARRSAKRLGKQQNELQSHYAEELRELRRENTELRRENDRLREHP
jgi:transposase-like protein